MDYIDRSLNVSISVYLLAMIAGKLFVIDLTVMAAVLKHGYWDRSNKQTKNFHFTFTPAINCCFATESESVAINLKRKKRSTLLIGFFISGVWEPLPRETRNIREVGTYNVVLPCVLIDKERHNKYVCYSLLELTPPTHLPTLRPEP